MIDVKNLSKSFGDFKALDDVNMHVEKGSIYGLVGPNGAGKTTTLKTMLKFVKPDSGKVEINGFDISTNEFDIKNMFYDMLNEGYEFVTTFNIENIQYFVFKKEKPQQICD